MLLAMALAALTLAPDAPTSSTPNSDAWRACENAAGTFAPQAAWKACSDIITAKPEKSSDLAFAYSNRGRALALQEEHAAAIKDYDSALSLNPQFPAALNNRGASYLAIKAYSRALSDFNAAIKIAPQFRDAMINRAACYFAMGDTEMAVLDYTNALALAPDSPDVLVRRGEAALALNMITPALGDFDQALRLNKNYGPAYHLRGYAHYLNKDMKRATQDYGEAIKLNPRSDKLFLDRANALLAMENYPAAIADYDQALSLGSQDEIALRNRCLARAAWGRDLKLAIEDCNAALAIHQSPITFSNRAMAQFRLGNFEAALADFDRAFQQDSTLVGALYGRGASRLRLGLSDIGATDLAAASKADPSVAKDFRRYGITP